MLERLNRLARLLAPLKWPAVILASGFALTVVAILWSSSLGNDDRWLIPCIAGFFASLSAYSLIATFSHIPRRAMESDSLWTHTRIFFYRSIYWLLAIVFIATTLIFLSMATQILGIWFQEN